jgi:hypothetical protein
VATGDIATVDIAVWATGDIATVDIAVPRTHRHCFQDTNLFYADGAMKFMARLEIRQGTQASSNSIWESLDCHVCHVSAHV